MEPRSIKVPLLLPQEQRVHAHLHATLSSKCMPVCLLPTYLSSSCLSPSLSLLPCCDAMLACDSHHGQPPASDGIRTQLRRPASFLWDGRMGWSWLQSPTTLMVSTTVAGCDRRPPCTKQPSAGMDACPCAWTVVVDLSTVHTTEDRPPCVRISHRGLACQQQ